MTEAGVVVVVGAEMEMGQWVKWVTIFGWVTWVMGHSQ